MQHYLIYNTLQNQFLRASSDNEGYVVSYDLVESVDHATIFTYEEIGYGGFEDNYRVIDIVNFLKSCVDDFEAYIFCACTIKYNRGFDLSVPKIDYINPLLDCRLIDERIGEKIIFK